MTHDQQPADAATPEAPPVTGWRAWWFPFALTHAVAAPVAAVQVRTLWQWFAVPAGAPSIGYAHAFGIALLAAAFTTPPTGTTTMRDEVTRRVSRAAQRLALGFVAHWMMTGNWR